MNNFVTDAVIAARNLRTHRLRSGLLGIGLVFVTLMICTMWATFTSMSESMLESSTALVTGHVNVGGFYKVTPDAAETAVTHTPDLLKATQAALGDDVDYIVERGRGYAKLISDTASDQMGMEGIDIAKEPAFKKWIHVESGNIDDLAKPGTVLIFHNQAEKFGVKVGDAMTFSTTTGRGVNNTVDVRVVAIGENQGLFSAFITFVPVETLRKLYDLRDDTTGALHVHLKDPNSRKEVASKLRLALEKDGYRVMDPESKMFFQKLENVNREDWVGQKIDVTTYEDEVSGFSFVIGGFGAISALLTVLLLAVVLVGVFNIMWIAVRERTREVGTLRAIGMQRERILRMFLTEAAVLGFVSSVVGALLCLLLALAVNHAQIELPAFARFFLLSQYLQLVLHPGPIVGIVVFITILTTIASLYPAYRAAKLQPVIAMSHAG